MNFLISWLHITEIEDINALGCIYFVRRAHHHPILRPSEQLQPIYERGNFEDVTPSTLHEYPIVPGFANIIISSGVAILELRKPVSSNRPRCCFLPAEKSGGGRSTVRGDTMLRRLLLVCALSMADDDDDDDDVLLWPSQDGVTMLSLSVSAVESLRGDTRLISTVSAKEILRSVQKGEEVVPGLTRLALLSWQLSISVVFGVGFEKSRLVVSAEEASLGRRIQLLCESAGKALRGAPVLLLWLQSASDEWDACCFLRMVRNWRSAGKEATAIPTFCSRLQGWISGGGTNGRGESEGKGRRR